MNEVVIKNRETTPRVWAVMRGNYVVKDVLYLSLCKAQVSVTET